MHTSLYLLMLGANATGISSGDLTTKGINALGQP